MDQVFSQIKVNQLIYIRKKNYVPGAQIMFLETGLPNFQITFPKSAWPHSFDPEKDYEGWVRVKKRDDELMRYYIAPAKENDVQIEVKPGGIFLGAVCYKKDIGLCVLLAPDGRYATVSSSDPLFNEVGLDDLCAVEIDMVDAGPRKVTVGHLVSFKNQKFDRSTPSAYKGSSRRLGSESPAQFAEISNPKLVPAPEPPAFHFLIEAMGDALRERGMKRTRQNESRMYDIIREDYIKAYKSGTILIDSNPHDPKTIHFSFPSSATLDRPLGKAPLYYGFKINYNEEEYFVEKCGLKTKNLYMILENDVYAKDWNEVTNELADMAVKEDWGSRTNWQTLYDNPLLSSYLAFTYYVAKTQDKVVRKELGSENLTIFNTGLVNNRYEYIYAVMEDTRGKSFRQPLRFLGFAVVGNGTLGKKISQMYPKLPERVQYIQDPSDLFLDTQAALTKCDIDIDHIITPKRISRLPLNFLEYICAQDKEALRILKSKSNDKWNRLVDRINDRDTNLKYRLGEEIRLSKDIAVKRTEWNYKTAIPIYFAARHTLSTIIPLTLPYMDISTGRVDAALVLSHNKASGRYQAETILTLDMAYANSRQIARPESDWLIVPKGTSGDDSD